MLNFFETSCINRPLHNEHENVIFAKKSFIEKDYKQFLVKIETKATRILFIFDIFFNFDFFHVFLVKVLNIKSADQNRNMHSFYKRKFQS